MAESALRRLIENPLETEAQRMAQAIPTPANKNFVRRYLNPDAFPVIRNPDGSVSTHRMASAETDGRYVAYPTIVQDSSGRLQELGEDEAFRYAMANNEFLQFPTERAAQAYADGGYKQGTSMESAPLTQSALRALMQGGPAPSGMASAQTAIQNAAQRPQPKPMGQQVADVLGGVSLPLSAVPVVGDVAGLGADAAMYANYPEERTLGNYGLTLAGMLPGIPAAAAMRTAKGGLDMSQAARMQRADEMGFNPKTLYHATSSDIDQFSKNMMGKSSSLGSGQKAVWLNTSPDVVETYLPGAFVNRANVKDSADLGDGVGRYYSEGGNIMPVRARLNPENTEVFDMGGARYDEQTVNAILKNAKKNKAKAVVFKNIRDEGVMGLGSGRRATSIAVFNPSDIRSVNAAFDPAKRNSANLMAGVMGGAVGLSALRQLMPQQEQE